jgi:hypothetical protein
VATAGILAEPGVQRRQNTDKHAIKYSNLLNIMDYIFVTSMA